MAINLFIQAMNVHSGGGRSLLHALLETRQKGLRVTAILDSRMDVPQGTPDDLFIRKVKPTIPHRLMAEWWLSKNVKVGDIVLCFGNLPPLFKLRGKVSVFMQNRYIIERAGLAGFSLKTSLRIYVERIWFALFASHVDEYIVQTQSMKRSLEIRLKNNASIYIMPLINSTEGFNRTKVQLYSKKDHLYDFVYVATGEPHKNHIRLIEAWCMLAADGLFPNICLTIGETSSTALCQWIESMKTRFRLNLVNRGMISSDQVKQLYSQARALIYPSTFESFGLPLIEARQAGLPILASELDYVRDILDPEESFDPYSAVSIARAVKRFMEIPERPLPLLNASEFIERITERLH